jgi:transcriptional regulator with XRE-family HTH domain
MSDFGQALRVLRITRELEQQQVARKAGVSKSALSEYEKGKKVPTVPALARVLEALDYSQAAHAEVVDFLQYLKEVYTSGVSPARDNRSETREVHQALAQIGRGATRLILLAFRLLLERRHS